MEIITEEVTVPAKSYIHKKYVACDGTVFSHEIDCLRHESRLRIENHPVFKSKITDIFTFEDDYRAVLYYLSCDDDFEWLLDNVIGHSVDANYEEYGPGWYLYYEIDGGDWPDIQHLCYFDTYEKEIEDRFNQWKATIHEKIKL